MGPSQICWCPFREPRVFTIAHIFIYNYMFYTRYTLYTPSNCHAVVFVYMMYTCDLCMYLYMFWACVCVSLYVCVSKLGNTCHERSAQHQMQGWWVWFWGVHEQDLAAVKARWHGRLATKSTGEGNCVVVHSAGEWKQYHLEISHTHGKLFSFSVNHQVGNVP